MRIYNKIYLGDSKLTLSDMETGYPAYLGMSLGPNAFKWFIGTSIFILRYIDYADNKGRCKIKRKILLRFGPQPPTPIDGKNKINEK